MTEYALWIVPRKDAYNKLFGFMNKLNRDFHSPRFEPHITVVSGLKGKKGELVEKAMEFASKEKSFEITLGAVNRSDEEFLQLYYNVDNGDVTKIQERAKKFFGCKEPLSPHLSLVYGNFSDKEKDEMEKLNEVPPNLSFEVYSVDLVNIAGPVTDWYRVVKCPFK